MENVRNEGSWDRSNPDSFPPALGAIDLLCGRGQSPRKIEGLDERIIMIGDRAMHARGRRVAPKAEGRQVGF